LLRGKEGGEIKVIDIKRYIKKKEKGLVTLSKLGTAAVISWDVFDQDTGEKLPPVAEALDPNAIKKLREETVSLLNQLDSLIKDIEALGITQA